MAVGAFGLGAADLPALANLDDRLTRPGFYTCLSATGAPSAFGVVHIVGRATGTSSSTWVNQVFYDALKGGVYERFSTNLLPWSPWRLMYHSANILGTVSQSGGVPTGAIIERGSNANGQYVKYADGTLICWHTTDGGRVNWFDWTYPAAYVAAPILHSAINLGGTSTNVFSVQVSTGLAHASVRMKYMLLSGGAWYDAVGEKVDLLAIGHWF